MWALRWAKEGMQDDIRRRFAALIRATGMTHKAASQAGGLGSTYVRDLIERNRGSLDNVLKIVAVIAPAYGEWVQHGRGSAPPDKIEPNRSIERLQSKRRISILGMVGGNGVARPVARHDEDEREVYAPDGAVALKIVGSSLGLFYDGWFALYMNDHAPFTEDLYGKLCVMGTRDGRTLVKVIRRGVGPGVQLVSGLGEIEDNVELEWASEVLSIQSQ